MPGPASPTQVATHSGALAERPDCALALTLAIVEWVYVEDELAQLVGAATGQKISLPRGSMHQHDWTALNTMRAIERTLTRPKVVGRVVAPRLPEELASRGRSSGTEWTGARRAETESSTGSGSSRGTIRIASFRAVSSRQAGLWVTRDAKPVPRTTSTRSADACGGSSTTSTPCESMS